MSLVQLDDYSGDGLLTGGYASARWTPFSRLTIAPGVRADRWSLTGQSTDVALVPGRVARHRTLKVRAGGGVYQQFPDFDKVLGVSGGAGLRPERAEQFDLGVEQRIGRAYRVSMTVYDREERDMLRRPGAETRVDGNRVVRASATTKHENRLEGFARGVELMVQRSITGAASRDGSRTRSGATATTTPSRARPTGGTRTSATR